MGGARFRAAALLAALAAPAPLAAFTLEPMSTLLVPSRAGSVATFRIRNDGTERIAIKVSVLTRAVTPEGNEENASAADLFTVYPGRLLVEPGITASVKVQWKGPAVPEAERAFRFLAEQVPIQDGNAEAGSGIRILFRYVASLYVGSRDFQPDLAVRVKGAQGPSGENGYLVEMENRGSRHVIATQAVLRVSDPAGGAEILLSGGDLGGLDGANYLAGGLRRRFLPRPEAVPGRSYHATIEFKGEF